SEGRAHDCTPFGVPQGVPHILRLMPSLSQHVRAILHRRCPRCLQGPIYQSGMKMNVRCPVCDLLMEREQGYFMGAMYISYALASAFLGVTALAIHLLLPELDLGLVILIAALVFLPFVPAFTRYSRVIWIHFDRWAWPDQA